MPDVSVIIPNYNHAPYLDRRLRSVLGQDREDFEVLFLDDHSTDESLDVLAAYRGDPRLRVILNSVNSGSTFIQWNRGIAEAKGRYVWIAESDDEAEPELLSTLVGRLEDTPGLTLAYCESLVIDEQSRGDGLATDYLDGLVNLAFWEVDRARWRGDFVAEGWDYCYRVQSRVNSIPNASAVVFRREAYLAAGGADPTMRLAGDWKIWGQIILGGGVAFVSRPLNRFRKHAQTTRHRSQGSWYGVEEAARSQIALVNALGLSEEQRAFWVERLAWGLQHMVIDPRYDLRLSLAALRDAWALSPTMARELRLSRLSLARVRGGAARRAVLKRIGLSAVTSRLRRRFGGPPRSEIET